ncbi:hypothetical protein ACFY1J_24030 [Streptomyces sp. NPDC001406]|uniref:hypothetical protein n=1 Tax=Streptomyces sp. NPDC001406 TaxID=3364572 RepID=UPI0036BC9260
MTVMISWSETLSDLLSADSLATLLATGIAAGVGTWGGAVVTLKRQSKIAEEDRKVQQRFAAEQRDLDQREQRAAIARNAAAELLEPVAALRMVVPQLPMLREAGSLGEQTATPMGKRRAVVREVLDDYKRAMWTSLMRLGDQELAGRYRALGTLASDLAYGGIETDSPMMNRAFGDIENYIKYLLISLAYFMDDKPLPDHVPAPYLKRTDGANWCPPGPLPDDWDQV